MRIYLPATFADLAEPVGLSARRAHAFTEALAAELQDSDPEAGELSALLAAATDSVDRLRAAPGQPRRRVVVAADVDGAQRGEAHEPTSVVHAPAVAWDAVVSVHVDADDSATQDLLASVLSGAETLDSVELPDLLWYDVSELDSLRAEI